MWYNIYNTKSHNALINMVVGPRGYGKTYGAKMYCLDNFINKNEQFIYLRRYQSELDLVKETLMDDVSLDPKYDEHEIEFKGGAYIVDGLIAGWAAALTTSSHLKSASFPKVTTIVFDEFIVDENQHSGYLKNEVMKMLNFIETVARMRNNVRVFMLANSLSFVNPYTIYWDMTLPKDKRICKANNGLVLLELVGDDEFKTAKQATLFGQLNQGSEFERMAVDNQFILDTNVFVEKRPPMASHIFVIHYLGVNIGIWFDRLSGLYYCSEDFDPSCRFVYAVTMDDHSYNTKLIRGTHRGGIDTITKAFKQGLARFENQKLKSYMTEVFKICLR